MASKETSKKRFYLKWPWNVLVYIILVVVLRIFAIPVILLMMWWNKKQQPDGPEEGYCLQRTRGRLTGLIWAALCLAGGGLAIWFFLAVRTMPYEMERLKEEISFGYYLIPVAGALLFWWACSWPTGACGMPWRRRRAPWPSPSAISSPIPTRRRR